MKHKVIGIIVCIFLICFSVLSKADILINDKDSKDLFIDMNNYLKPTIDGSHSLDFWIEQGKLQSSDGQPGDNFGSSVAIDGNYAIVGVYNKNDGAGSVYAFLRSGNTWTEDQKIVPSDVKAGDYYGDSVALSGDYAIVGSRGDDNGAGSAYVYKRSGGNWVEDQKLVASDREDGDYFGCSVAIDGNYAIVGANGDDNFTGSVYVYNNSGSNWVEEIKLISPEFASDDYFGSSIDIDGDFVIIGVYGDDECGGSAFILEHCCYWAWRDKINISKEMSYFGWSVSISDPYAIIGAPGEPTSNSPGSSHVFKRDGNRWHEQKNWSGENSGDHLGMSVSIDGNYAIAGACGDDNINGSAFIFNLTGINWTVEQKLFASDGQHGDYFGCSVSIDAGNVIIGAYGDESFTGSAYVFINSGIPDLSIKISGGFGVNVKITNNGEYDVKNLDFTIHINGGIFEMIDRSFYYTIDISSGESKTLSTGLFMGIGIIEILTSTDFEEKTAKGIQLLFLSIVY